jgi:uncharacterized protein YneF (UPF0154 family)
MTTLLIIVGVMAAIYLFAAVGYYYTFKNFPM